MGFTRTTAARGTGESVIGPVMPASQDDVVVVLFRSECCVDQDFIVRLDPGEIDGHATTLARFAIALRGWARSCWHEMYQVRFMGHGPESELAFQQLERAILEGGGLAHRVLRY